MTTRKKVILYNPKSVFFDMPLALLAIGSALDQDKYEVVIIDGRIEANPEKSLLKACEDALCIGMTVLTGKPIKDALDMSRLVKKHYPSLPLVWGGWHTSLFPTETLQEEPAVDVTVQGQGEATFKELIQCFEANLDLADVAGICYRKEGHIIKNQKRHLVDLNSLPSVNYGLIDVEQYFKAKGRRQLDYISSTGCHFRCTFCADPFVYDRAWTAIEPERMGAELAYLKSKYQFTDINFQDETFFTKTKRVREIAQQLLDLKIDTTWAGTMRADQGNRLEEADFDLCKKSGLRRVLVGVESGSQEMMDWLKKDIKMEHVYRTAARCKERGIAVIFPFIIGFPNESRESFEASLKMALELNAMDAHFDTPIFYFKPYPGSQITQQVVEEGYQLPQTLSEWADFDYIGSSGPWVDKEKHKLVEQYKFYMKMAYRPSIWYLNPLQWLAKVRCEKRKFHFPIEKIIFDLLIGKKALS